VLFTKTFVKSAQKKSWCHKVDKSIRATPALCLSKYFGNKKLFAYLTTDFVASIFGHGNKTLAFTGALSLTGIGSRFAVIITFALVDTITVDLGVITGMYGSHRCKCKQTGGRYG
jgi:hypothetical protein